VSGWSATLPLLDYGGLPVIWERPRIDSASDVQISVSEIAECCYFPRQLAGRF
jgi:hypothetical protein